MTTLREVTPDHLQDALEDLAGAARRQLAISRGLFRALKRKRLVFHDLARRLTVGDLTGTPRPVPPTCWLAYSAYLVADPEPLELAEPGEGPLDDPAGFAQAGTVGCAFPGGLRCDAAGPEETAVLVVVGRRTAGPAGDVAARGMKAYASASPITRASGKKASINRRWVKSDRLNHADYLWAFAALKPSPGAKAHYARRREAGDWHAAAQRNLFNKMIGQLFHCLQKHILFDEDQGLPAQASTTA